MLQNDLQTMIFNPDDMHIPTLKIEQDMEFQKWLSVKQFPGNFSKSTKTDIA
jgi:hypothetical protein